MNLTRMLRSKLILIVLAPFILLAPVYLTGRALFWGTPGTQFVPWRDYAWEMFRTGQIPLLNPLIGMGAPLIANYQSAVFYPPNWLYFLIDEIAGIGALAWLQAPLVAAHLVLAGFGMVFLTRRLDFGVLSQCISGLAFGLSGYLVSRAGFLSINSTVAWLPWVVLIGTNLIFEVKPVWSVTPRNEPLGNRLFLKQVYRSANISIISMLKLSLVLGMMLFAGHAQTSWYTLVLVLIWCGFLIFSQINDPKDRKGGGSSQNHKLPFRKLVYIFLAVVFILGLSLITAIAITSIQIFPTIEYLLESQRASQVDFEAGLSYSFWPWRFLTLVAPDMFGNPAKGDYWGYANYWEDAVYIGLLPFVLAIIAIWNGLKRARFDRDGSLTSRRMLIKFLFGVIVLSFILALGKNTPIFPWLYRYVPTFDMFNAPTRFSLWAVFALSLLAGIGVEYWNRPTNRPLYWTRLGLAGAFAIMLGAGIAWISMGDISPSFLRATTIAGAWLIVIGVLTLSAPKTQTMINEREAQNVGSGYPIWSWLVCSFVALDLVISGWGLNPGIDLDFYTLEAPTTSKIREEIGDGRLFIPYDDEYSIKFDRFFKFQTFDPGEDWVNLRAVQLPNLSMFDNLHAANNFDPIVPGRFAVWMDHYRESTHEKRAIMLNLMGVNVVEEVDFDSPYGVEFVQYESMSRIRWIPCGVLASSGENALELILSEMLDIHSEVVLEDVQPILLTQCDRSASGRVDVEFEGAHEIRISVNADNPGFVNLSNVWYPGWLAEIDDKPTKIFRANYLFSAVAVPDGTHELRLVYKPSSFYVGAMVSLVSTFGMVLLIIYLIRKYRLKKE